MVFERKGEIMRATKEKEIIRQLRIKILELVYKSKEGHIASSFSILDILWILYNRMMDFRRDHFILSKGHASLALYVVLNEFGYISTEELEKFCEFDSKLGGHPKLNKELGIHASTGSLGHGLPIAVGMALAKKIKDEDGMVYCLIGDGESNEGSIWESALLAQQYKLNNLCCIVDYNHSSDRAINMDNIGSKFDSFEWEIDWCNGHNYLSLYDTFSNLNNKSNKPKVIIAETIKGYGCKTMENNPVWHHKIPNENEYLMLLEELK